MRKYIRSIQTRFPFLQDTRYKLQFWYRDLKKMSHEKDFTLIKHFKPDTDEVFVDIGSNRGESIQSMHLFAKPQTRIIGFEPNPLIFNKLSKICESRDGVEVHNFGLSNDDGEFKLFIPFYRNWMFDGLSSVHHKNASEWLNENRIWNFNPEKLQIKDVDCKLKKLDAFNLSPYFMKMDVQGHEMSVLKGAVKTITEHKPILLIESITEEIQDYLKDFGYQFYHLKGDKLYEGKGHPNTFCIPGERKGDLEKPGLMAA